MKIKKILYLLGLISQLGFGQSDEEKLIHGRIIVDTGVVGGVTVINLKNEKSTVSDNNGDFNILAKTDDLLVFSSTNLDYYRKIIEKEDLKPAFLIIKMTSKITELEEVIINKHPEINAVSLGISPAGIKHLTQVERRLYTANSTPGDALLNYMSGRTEMIKKEIIVEKKLSYIQLIEYLFEDNYFLTSLKIPSDYINGFKYYLVENEDFTKILSTKNKAKIELAMGELAPKYQEIIAAENK